jgi:hypothetical protein
VAKERWLAESRVPRLQRQPAGTWRNREKRPLFATDCQRPARVVLDPRMALESVPSRQLTIFGLVLIVVPTIAAINLGAQAVSDREFPLVTLEATPIAPASTSASAASQEDSIEIKIIARAVGMTTQNDLLVQLIGLYADPAESPTGATPTPSVTLRPFRVLLFIPRSWGCASRITSPGLSSPRSSILQGRSYLCGIESVRKPMGP